MGAIGIGLAFVGYTLGLYGFILLKGYNISFKELWSPTNWPPAPTKPKGK